MDYLRELGALAIASRLRRLLGRLGRDGMAFYRDQGVSFQIRWFPVFHLLSKHAPMSVTEIAEALSLTHPAVVQVVGALKSHGLVASTRSPTDGRRRVLELTSKGQTLLATVEPLWEAFREAGEALVSEHGNDFLGALEEIEAALDRKPMYDRITERLDGR